MKYDGKNLKEVLEAHKRWVSSSDPDEYDRADLSEADLHGANLFRVDLSGANLYKANLSGADLREAKLCEANLYRADLHGAKLYETDLFGADLYGADLHETNLYRTNLHGVNIFVANLRGAKNTPIVAMMCPDTGSFIGWKKCSKNLIVKLQIPEDAKRCSATGRKCRCDKALVLEIQNIDGTKADIDTAHSTYDNHFAYRVGETVEPESPFDEDRWNECASGIHFFINREEAVYY